MAPAARTLAEWTASLRLEDVPQEVRDAARLHMLDAVGTGLAGLAMGELEAARGLAEELGGRPEATALGLAERLPAAVAAFANGAVMHALDFDDTHEHALVHSSVVVAPVALACGEAFGASGEEVLTAAIAGFEVGSRIGLAGAGKLHVRGFHPTSVCGTFAAAAIAGRLRGLDAGGIANALGIAGSQASGLLEFLADGSQTKPIHPGWASFAGIVAAGLAARGATGPATVLDGRFGLLRTHLDEFDEPALTAGLGTDWETLRVAYKPYPTCHCTHTCLDALAALVAEEGLTADGAERIECRVPSRVAVELVLEPAERKRRPTTPYDAKFSMPYCLGSLLVRGSVDVGSFTPEAIREEEVLAVGDRVSYRVEPFPGGNDLSGGVTVTTRDGRTLTREVLFPRGGLRNPMSEADVVAKFRANATLALPEAAADRLVEAFESLEESGVAPIAAELAGAVAAAR
jgi:2-methylcitrate dehydratase PrpD